MQRTDSIMVFADHPAVIRIKEEHAFDSLIQPFWGDGTPVLAVVGRKENVPGAAGPAVTLLEYMHIFDRGSRRRFNCAGVSIHRSDLERGAVSCRRHVFAWPRKRRKAKEVHL